MEKKVGYTCLTNIAYGMDLVWSSQETPDSEIWPDIYPDEESCRKEMVDEVIHHLDEYIAGDREYDMIVWPENEYQVVYIEIENGQITCWETPETAAEEGRVSWIINYVYKKSLTEWRQEL